MHFHILTILEHILRITLETVDIDILTEHERISATMQFHIFQAKTVNTPERLVGITYFDILQFHVFHLAEELRTVNATTAHHQVIRIPDGRARPFCKITIFDKGAVNVPPGVFAIETTVFRLHPLALLDTTLAIGYRDVLQSQIVGSKQWAFASEFLVFYELHAVLFLLYCRHSILLPLFNCKDRR